MAKDLIEGKIYNVRYHSMSKDETTFRTIIPTALPTENVKGIDVTDLSPEEQQEMCQLTNEYSEYWRNKYATIFDFATWVEHTKNKQIQPKYRTFKPANLKVVD